MSIARAACLVTASEREGYGLVVVEAAAHGTPSVVVAGPENAATELVRDGVNGVVSPDASPESLAAAITRVVDSGTAMRESTASWFRRKCADTAHRPLARARRGHLLQDPHARAGSSTMTSASFRTTVVPPRPASTSGLHFGSITT